MYKKFINSKLPQQPKPALFQILSHKRAQHRTFIERLWLQPKKLWARESCLLGKPLFLSRNVWVKLTDSPSRWHHLMIIKGLLWHSQPCLAAKWITFGVSYSIFWLCQHRVVSFIIMWFAFICRVAIYLDCNFFNIAQMIVKYIFLMAGKL